MTELLLFICGIAVGGMNAIAGGGMLLGFPALLFAGLPAIVANATTGLIVLPGQISAVYGYRAYLAKIPRRYLLLIIPTTLGAVIGATLLRHTSHEHFDRLVPLLILGAVVLFIFQPFLHQHTNRHIHGSKRHRDRWQPLLLLALAFVPISIYGGFFGAGFGFLMLAFLGFTPVHEIHRINALKNLLAIGIASGSLITLAGSHLIDWHHGAFMSAGCLIGGYVGARLAQRVPSHAVRITVIIIGLSAAAYLGFRTY